MSGAVHVHDGREPAAALTSLEDVHRRAPEPRDR